MYTGNLTTYIFAWFYRSLTYTWGKKKFPENEKPQHKQQKSKYSTANVNKVVVSLRFERRLVPAQN